MTTYRYINDQHRDITERALCDRCLGALAHTHPDIIDIAYIDLFGTQYTRRSGSGRVTEQWTKSCGEWVDTTAIAQMAEDKEQRQRELVRVVKALRKAQEEQG